MESLDDTGGSRISRLASQMNASEFQLIDRMLYRDRTAICENFISALIIIMPAAGPRLSGTEEPGMFESVCHWLTWTLTLNIF